MDQFSNNSGEQLPEYSGQPLNVPADPSSSSNDSGSRPPFKLTRQRIIVVTILVLIALFLGLIFFIWQGRTKSAKTTTDSTQLQDISTNELKQFTNAFLKPTTNQVVTITPNAHFNNAVTVDKILTAGAISTQNLNISGPVNLDSVNINANLFVGGGTTLQGVVEARSQLNVRGPLTASNASFSGDLAVAGTITAGTLSVGDLTTKNLIVGGDLTVNGHLALLGGAVTASTGPGVGSGGSVQVFGNDVTGTIIINVGSSPIAGQMAIITFKKPYPGVPHVSITPIGQSAGALQWYATRAASFLSIDSASSPTSGTQYAFDYFVQR